MQQFIPSIQRITALAIRITEQGKYQIWTRWSGHVKEFEIDGCKGEWNLATNDFDERLRKSIYLNATKWRTEDQIHTKLAEIEALLMRLEAGFDLDEIVRREEEVPA